MDTAIILSHKIADGHDIILYIYHEMKGDRDGKSAETSATRHCLYSAVVVNVSPSSPISFFMFL